ncbi:hypothetical protein J2S53_001222 [Actinopolyspora lacussalsi]|uniref:Uncharacterized protein n=1 Tax=Actinopolyspora alba TaxID=673379 RepID=A0A1I1ZND4_9ACTN|nr:hypothetical protein [Actinopolyspora alba]MDP9641277.1 hypothetical protein [Actinopolyspora lacussalsi]SFE33227.1 hypothetical protein SAMN04487819_11162 [Actinopolyspora alba]
MTRQPREPNRLRGYVPAFSGELHEPPRKRTTVPHSILERVLDGLHKL